MQAWWWLVWIVVRGARSPARWAAHRFTPAGVLVLLGMVLTLATANPRETMGMPASALLVLMMAVAMAWSWTFRSRVRVRRTVPTLAECDEPFPVAVALSSSRLAGPAVEDGLMYGEDLRSPPPALSEIRSWLRRGQGASPTSTPVEVPRIAAHGTVTVTVQVTARRRGVLSLPGGMLSRTDPLNLFRAFVSVPEPRTVLIMPRRHPLPSLALPGIAKLQPGGVVLASGVGQAEEFVALRDYRRGDPPKHIHWRTTARTGELAVKEFHDEQIVRHALVLDADMPDTALFEDAVAVAASFACTLPDQDSLLDLLLIDGRAVHLLSGRGVGHAQPMLEALAVAAPRPGSFPDLAELVERNTGALSACLLVVAAFDRPRRELVRVLRCSGVPVVVLLLVAAGRREAPVIADPGERPERLILIEAGRVRDDLQQVGIPG